MASKMPVLFIGHDSPMNAIADNEYTRALKEFANRLAKPKAVLCVSAHWMSEGSWITHMERPRTIHDFYGFPQELFEIQYPAPSDPQLARSVKSQILDPEIQLDNEMWGFDHGTWSVLRHMYPQADVPVMQLSIYMEQPPAYHLKLAQQLRALREKGILIVGSGNIVHNLRKISWETDALAFDWAIEFDEWVKQKLEKRDFESIALEALNSATGKLAHPTPDHWYPFIYSLGAADPNEELSTIYEGLQNASISMRSVCFGSID